jgi:AcrR family transcriptional regulator
MPKSSRVKSEETRASIVEAAYQVFMEGGYHGASMRDVSRRAGLTVGAIYNHFATKEELWVAVLSVKHPYHEILPSIVQAEGETISDMARSAADRLVQGLLKRPDLFNLLFTEVVEFKGKHVPILFEQIFPEVLKLRDTFQNKQGKLRDFPTATILRSFVGLFVSYYITGILFNQLGGIAVESKSLNQFVDLYLYGIMAEDDPSRAQTVKTNSSPAPLT